MKKSPVIIFEALFVPEEKEECSACLAAFISCIPPHLKPLNLIPVNACVSIAIGHQLQDFPLYFFSRPAAMRFTPTPIHIAFCVLDASAPSHTQIDKASWLKIVGASDAPLPLVSFVSKTDIAPANQHKSS